MANKAKKLTKKQKDFLEIFEKNMCLVTPSVKKAKIGMRTYYNWRENPLFLEKVDQAKESIKDFGENALHQLIRDKNPAAVIFFNKCRNKDRGYIEKQEVEHSSQGFQIQLIEKSVEEIKSEKANNKSKTEGNS